MAEADSNAKLSEVSSKLTSLNQSQNTGLGNLKALTETLVAQGKTAAEAADSIASAEAEARREASRQRKGKTGAQNVNVLNWQKEEDKGMFSGLMDMMKMKFAMGGFSFGDLFKKGGIKKLLALFGTTLFGGIKTAFAAVGTKMTGLLGPTLMKFLSPMAIITGLVLAIKDGISGMASSMDWGVSKISGFLGGFFAGEADGGIMNMFKNAGKWALIGAGIGSVVPVIGTLVGGLVGGAIGGILGLIGAKKIAKAFDKIGAWFKKVWGNVTEFVGKIWTKIVDWFKEKWEWASGKIAAGWTNLSAYLGGVWDDVVTWFKGLLSWGEGVVTTGWTNLTTYLGGVWDDVYAWFTGLLSWGEGVVTAGWTNLTTYLGGVWDDVYKWFTGLLSWGEGVATGAWTGLTGFVSEKWAQVKKWFEDLLTFEGDGGEKIGIGEKIIQLFAKIPDKIVALFEKIVQSVKDIFNSISLPSWMGGKEKLSPEEAAKKRADLSTKLKVAQSRKTTSGIFGTGVGGYSEEDRAKEIAEIQNELGQLPKIATGGPILRTGPAVVHKGELMMDNQAAMMMFRSAELLSRLQVANGELKRDTTSSAVQVINNNTSQSNIRTSTSPMMALSSPINPHNKNSLPGRV